MAAPKHGLCSVWNWDRLDYDYYAVPGAPRNLAGYKPLSGLGIRKPRQLTPGGLGVDIEDALPPLPGGARHVGRGQRARGTVCRRPFLGISGTADVTAGASSSTADMASAAGFGFVAGFILGGLKGSLLTGALGLAAGYALGSKKDVIG